MARILIVGDVGDVHTARGRRDEAAALFAETEAQVRLQDGCLRYAFAEAVGEPGRFVLVQEWRDEGAMRAHFESAPFQDYQARVGPLLAGPSEVQIHRVAETIRPEDSRPLDPASAD